MKRTRKKSASVSQGREMEIPNQMYNKRFRLYMKKLFS